MATHLKHPKYYENTYIPRHTNKGYYYTCAGCGKKRQKYIGEMYITRDFGFKGEPGFIHKYCCSEKCYYFAWLQYMERLSKLVYGKSNPQLFSEPQEYITF
jgi:hypothetical protein